MAKSPDRDTTGENPPGHDRLFTDDAQRRADFRFNAATASVFDDMVDRSVPFYREMQRMACEMAADFAQPGSNLVDLGCSTGTTLLQLDACVEPSLRFVGIDNSQAMLDQARTKLAQNGMRRDCELVCADLHSADLVADASVVLMLLTLQFVRPLYRERVMRRIHAGMHANGCLILIEKLTVGDSLVNRLFIRYYYDMKRRHGYSDMEIANKREALENVLIPYREEENRDLLLGAGFRHVETFFRWYNFCGVLAVK